MKAQIFEPEIIKEEKGLKAGVVEFDLDFPAFMQTGWGNGYVGLPKGHPWYGMDRDEIPVEVHYGLTFAREFDGVYWIGFDTAHYQDTQRTWPRERVEKETLAMLDQALKAIL